MSRNQLLKLSLQPRSAPGVWRMTLVLIGQAFGARPQQNRERGR